jgi:hypothetical protein
VALLRHHKLISSKLLFDDGLVICIAFANPQAYYCKLPENL